mgnify:FL=1
MEKIIKEGKTVEEAIKKLMEENNLSKEEFLYTSTVKKGKLFQGTIYEVTAFLKSDINNELKEFIRKLVENVGLEVSIEVTNKDDRLTIRLFSNKDKILIGREGATLKAIETIAKQYIQNTTGIYYKFNLDVSNYKEKNQKRLEWLAKKTAKEVVETKMPASLDNMTSYERRIIHNILTDFKGVKTESEGEEPNRHVVIKPL